MLALSLPARRRSYRGLVQLGPYGALKCRRTAPSQNEHTVAFHWAKDYKGRGYFRGQFAVPTNDNHDLVGSVLWR